VVVGGTQLAATATLPTKRLTVLLLSVVAEFGMLTWTLVELAMIQQLSWLQVLYFGLGGLELIPVQALLGIIPTLASSLRACETMRAGAPSVR